MWQEENTGNRISEMRIEQVLKTKSATLATACPLCLQMFEDAVKAKDCQASIRIMDIAELVAGVIEGDLPVSERANTEQPQHEGVRDEETPPEE